MAKRRKKRRKGYYHFGDGVPTIRRAPRSQRRRRRRRPAPAAVHSRPAQRRRDFTLLILEFFANIGGKFRAGYLRVRGLPHFRAISGFAAVVVLIVAAAAAFYFFTRPNALTVYLGDAPVGIVRLEGSRNVDGDYITLHARARLESRLGSHVRFDAEVATHPVRANPNDTLTFDNLMSRLVNILDYYVYGAIIIINGAEAALLSSPEAAETLLYDIAQSFRRHPAADFSHHFVEDVEILRRYVHRGELMTPDDALHALTAPRTTQDVHTVRSGDSLYSIAMSAGMSLSSIIAHNPQINPEHFLQLGQNINIIRTAPALSVVTIEREGNVEIMRINGVLQSP